MLILASVFAIVASSKEPIALPQIVKSSGVTENSVNGVANGQESAAIAAASLTVVDTVGGPSVTTVKASDPWTGVEYTYWMKYGADGVNRQLDLAVLVIGNGNSPLKYQIQHFEFPTGYGGTTSVPFAITKWGGDATLGPSYFLAIADGVFKGYYAFTVTN